jgi:hypothetical protein
LRSPSFSLLLPFPEAHAFVEGKSFERKVFEKVGLSSRTILKQALYNYTSTYSFTAFTDSEI